MDAAAEGHASRNRAEQTRLYGAPLGEVVDSLTQRLGITRAALAALLGLSAPMVSQLASAQRLKIGNPAAVQRLQWLMELSEDVVADRLTAQEAMALVSADTPGGVLTRSSHRLRREGAGDVQQVLRWAGTPEELERAATLLEEEFPAVAEVLRVYGAGTSIDAAAHFERVLPA